MRQLSDSLALCPPAGTLFSDCHTWLRKNNYGLIKIGVDEITLNLLEEVTIGKTAKVGSYLSKYDFLFEIVSESSKISVKSPIGGTLSFLNPFLRDKSIKHPYEDDWVVLLTASRFIEDKKELFTSEEYRRWIISSLDKFGESFAREFISGNLTGYKRAGMKDSLVAK